MRLVAGFALILMSSLAVADEPGPSPVTAASVPSPGAARAGMGLRVVRVLPETHQALLFDRDRGTHVLASIGSTIGTYRVEAIEGDAVTLTGPGREIVLAAPDRRWAQRRSLEQEIPRRIKSAERAPADPYAEAADVPEDPYAHTPTPLDPYAVPVGPYIEAPVRVVDAPPTISPGDGGVRVASAAPIAPADATASDEPSAAAPTRVILPRAQVSAALADFAVLTRAVRGSFTAQGARIETVALGSVFASAGLRAGDVVTAVDGRPLRSIDDAAELYLRAPTTTATAIELVRDGKPLTLHLAIQ